MSDSRDPFDIDAKFGDVTPLEQCLHYLETVGRSNEPA